MSPRFCLLFLAASRLFAAFTFTVTPNAIPNSITHTGARVLVSTSVATTARVVWDTQSRASCNAYLNSDTDGASHATHNWFIGGAPPNQQIFWRWCANDGTGEVGSTEQSFTTLPLPVPHPTKAALPAATLAPVVPTQTGTTRTVGVSTGCSDLLACWNASSCGDTINIRAANPIFGYWALPAKACDAAHWILIETDQASLLPPAGVRVDPSYLSVLASVENSAFQHYQYNTALNNGNCHPGAYGWQLTGWPTSNAAGFNMQQCVQNSSVLTITNITGCSSAGNGNIGSCSVTTSTNHNFSAANGGDIVYVTGVGGIAKANGTCRVTSITSATVFVMTCSAGYVDLSNTYVSGGTVANHLWQAVSFTPVTLGASPTYLPPAGACSSEGAWGYDSTHATQNYDPSLGPILGTSSTGSVVRCVKSEDGLSLVWRRWTVFLGDPTGGLTVNCSIDLSGSSYVYLLGLRFTHVNIPAEPLFLRDGGAPEGVTAFQGGKAGSSFVKTDINSSNIVLDRVLADGGDYPNGMASGIFTLNGNNIALVESYLTNCGYWFGAQDRGPRYDNYASACVIRSGGATSLLRNNYIQAYGISMHHDDSLAAIYNDSDVTTARNTFYRNPTHFYGSSANTAAYPSGVYWPMRQLYEHKSGLRVLVDGNTVTNNWRNVSQGGGIQFSNRMEASAWNGQYATVTGGNTLDWGAAIPITNLSVNNWLVCTVGGLDQLYQVLTTPTTHSVTVASIANGSALCARADWPFGIQDVTVSNNTFSGLPNAIGALGSVSPDTTVVQSAIVSPLCRVYLYNNLYNDILDDGTRQDPKVWQSSGGGYVFLNPHPFGCEIISNHETAYAIAGMAATVIGSGGSGFLPNVEGLSITNDLFSMRDPATCSVPANCTANSPVNASGRSGSAMMSAAIVNGTLSNGLFQMAGGDPTGYPGSIQWLNGAAAYKFMDAANGNFRLRSDSPGISGASPRIATDGLDVGAAIDTLEAAQGKVSNVGHRSVTQTSAIISFLAPDSVGCSVDWSTSAAFPPASLTRVANAGGVRTQDVSLTLPSHNTQYFYRVNCQVQQPTGSFTTRP